MTTVYIDLDEGGELVLTTDAEGVHRDPSGAAWGTDCDRVYDTRPGAWLRLDGDMIRGVEAIDNARAGQATVDATKAGAS